MRSYPVNSPQAMARIVALMVVADGDIGEPEVNWLDQLAVHEQLGLTRAELHAVIDTFCEDLLSSGQLRWADVCPVDERTLRDLMGQIDDEKLRLKLFHLCADLAQADARVQHGEMMVLRAAFEHWGLRHGHLHLPRP